VEGDGRLYKSKAYGKEKEIKIEDQKRGKTRKKFLNDKIIGGDIKQDGEKKVGDFKNLQ